MPFRWLRHTVGQSATWCLLSLQAQCIVFARYPDVLEPFKYAGYPLLLQAVTLPESQEPATSHWTDAENNVLLQVGLLHAHASSRSADCGGRQALHAV